MQRIILQSEYCDGSLYGSIFTSGFQTSITHKSHGGELKLLKGGTLRNFRVSFMGVQILPKHSGVQNCYALEKLNLFK